MNNQQIIGLVQDATKEVFSMMLGMDPTSGDPYEETGATESFAGVVALVGIGGPWVGMGTIYCGTELALQVTGAMLMQEQNTVNDEVLDAMAELANMIVGNVKTILEEELGPLMLSIPTVIFGRNYQALNGMGKSRVVVPFEVAGHKMFVKFFLTRQEATQQGRQSGMAQMLT